MQASNIKEFGEKVKAYLHGEHFTLQNLAKFVHLDYSTLSNFLNGKRVTSQAHVHIQNIVKALANQEIIKNRGQATDLLNMVGCLHLISDSDWAASPFNKLKLVPLKELEPSLSIEPEASMRSTHTIPTSSTPVLDVPLSSERIKTLETFSQEYRDSLKRDAQIAYLQIPGMRNPLALSKTYIRLKVHKENLNEQDLNKRVETALNPDKAIREKTRCIIMGDPGSGKTSLLKYLTLASANKDLKDLPDLPIYIKLNEFVESSCNNLLEFAAVDWNMRCGIPNAYAVSYLEEKLRAGTLIMLLDALDETTIGKTAYEERNSYLRTVRAIQDLTKISSIAPIVVTMRKTNLPDPILTGFCAFDVLGLRQEEIYQFVENWCEGQSDSLTPLDVTEIKTKLDRNPRIMALAANPLMLSLILLTYKDYFKDIPERRTRLFERCANMLLNEWGAKRSTKRTDGLDIEQKKQLLQYIAWRFHTQGQREFTEDELLSAITDFLEEYKLTKYEILQILEEISNEDGFIKKNAYSIYSFLHLTLQEYFVAKYITSTGQLDLLLSERGNPWWEEIFLLYIDCTNEPIILLNKLLGIDNDSPLEDLFYTNLVLAGCCLSIRPDLKKREIYQQITHRLFDAFLNARPDLATKERIVYTLVKIGGEEVIDQLIALLHDPKVNHHLYNLIVYAFDWHLHDRSMAHKLVQLLKVQHIKYDPLRNIPWVLAKIGERSVIPDMIKLLSDTQIHNYVRGEIADSLGTLGDQSTVPYLLEVLKNPHLDQYVAQWTARSVENLCDTSLLPTLFPNIANIWTDWGATEILLDAFEMQADYSIAKS